MIATLIGEGYAHCRAVATEHGGLLLSLFIAGLIGSPSHCVGMCGPFVLAQTVARLEAVPASRMHEFHRLAGAALVPYHLGRGTTYMALGAAGAALAEGMIRFAGLRWLQAALLATAATFFLGYAAQGFGRRWRPPQATSGTDTGWGRTIGRIVRPLFARPLGWRGWLLGVALGFLPCGLLWGAVAAAAASGGPLGGALGMAAFTLGTVPALLAVGLAGHVAGERFHALAARAMPVLMLVNAATLSYLAWRTIA